FTGVSVRRDMAVLRMGVRPDARSDARDVRVGGSDRMVRAAKGGRARGRRDDLPYLGVGGEARRIDPVGVGRLVVGPSGVAARSDREHVGTGASRGVGVGTGAPPAPR